MKFENISADEAKASGIGFESQVYYMGNGEAEVKTELKDIGKMSVKKASSKITSVSKHIAAKLAKNDCTCVHFVAEAGTDIYTAYDNAKAFHVDFSEYIMKWEFGEKDVFDREAGIVLMGVEDDDTDNEQKDAIIVNSAETGIFKAKLMPYRDGMYVYEVEVAEGERHKGNGYKYMRSIMNSFKDAPLYLQVGSRNENACALYKKLGFKVEQELCYYLL